MEWKEGNAPIVFEFVDFYLKYIITCNFKFFMQKTPQNMKK